jgi:hypothetical protein
MSPLGLAGGPHEMTRVVSFVKFVLKSVTGLDSIGNSIIIGGKCKE